MGEENTSNSSLNDSPNNSSCETQVILNVYDLTPINHYTVWFGFGVFHSGIEVHGKEYGFGAHDFPFSGVFEVEPKRCPGFMYRCSIPLGSVNNLPLSQFRTFIESVASEYHGDTYHLIYKNCNNFTDDIAKRLLGKGIPGWVNRLASLGSFCNCLLPESFQATTVKQLPEYHIYTDEDGSGSQSTLTPHERTDCDDGDQDKHLLSPSSEGRGVAFLKEVPR
ncbi:unnamed protein product [Cuscuta epithymum]|uniref:PPPDE domain-containing protein n=1 Tax=Cuscuta epithymum TaxID=186058 RepID=A0AAV0C932_9ASTE|nr:unnamed protein product [Cuscuta epithymum]